MLDPPDDRRKAQRAPIELKVTYKKLNTFFHDYTRNISKGGTFIQTDKPLDLNTEFLFKLIVPELSEPIVLKGKVRWVVSEDEAGDESVRPYPGMGIQFIYDTPDERNVVESIVGKLMTRHLGERAYVKLMGKERSS